MNTTKKNLIESAHAVFQTNSAYASDSNAQYIYQQYSELINSDTFGNMYSRFSLDNGRSWSQPQLAFEPEVCDEGSWRRGESALLYVKEGNMLIRFFNYTLYPGDYHLKSVARWRKIYYELSFDGGMSFSTPCQIIEKGFTSDQWARNVEFGSNSLAISFCRPLLHEGKIILPVSIVPQGCDYDEEKLLVMHSRILRGEFRNGTIQWECSESLDIDTAKSSRGLCEGAVESSGSRLFMVLRGSNTGLPRSVPGYKWKSVSEDGGISWSKVEPLCYDDRTNFFSPATGSVLIRHSGGGKMYWFGNIVSENPDGNVPRYPLQMAEINEENFSVVQDSVRIIDDRQPEDSELLQLSNFKVYEDCVSGEFVLIMMRFFAGGRKNIYSEPALEYRICL